MLCMDMALYVASVISGLGGSAVEKAISILPLMIGLMDINEYDNFTGSQVVAASTGYR